MSTPKEQMVEMINEQPDDSSYDEILRELAFKRMVDKGLDDVRSGRTVSNEDVSRRIRSWQK
jgi:predicted transcriptional regulator